MFGILYCVFSIRFFCQINFIGCSSFIWFSSQLYIHKVAITFWTVARIHLDTPTRIHCSQIDCGNPCIMGFWTLSLSHKYNRRVLAREHFPANFLISLYDGQLPSLCNHFPSANIAAHNISPSVLAAAFSSAYRKQAACGFSLLLSDIWERLFSLAVNTLVSNAQRIVLLITMQRRTGQDASLPCYKWAPINIKYFVWVDSLTD